MSDPLYHDVLLSHYHTPLNYGLMEDFDIEAKGENPLCGDSLVVRLKVVGDRIEQISFEHQGCVISRAACSMLFEDLKGKSKNAVSTLDLGYVIKLLGITLMPARIKCALLALETIQKVV